MGTGYHGGFGRTEGVKKQHQNKQFLPQNDAQLKHIFSGKEGHLTDTPMNRKVLTDLANDQNKYIGTDKYGNSWNIETTANGEQIRVRYRDGKINEGGRNLTPRHWNKETGLNHNPFKRRKKKK